jgi:prolipoprotein diacylglyceryltransferase
MAAAFCAQLATLVPFLFGLVTMGQSLSLVMVAGGLLFWIFRVRQEKNRAGAPAAAPRHKRS